MNEKKLNISLIKEMLKQEIKKNDDIIKEEKNIKSEISFLEEAIKLIETEDYTKIKENFIMFDTIIELYFNGTSKTYKNVSSKIYKAIYNCYCYQKNSEKYQEEDFVIYRKEVLSFTKKLKNILEKYTAKLLITKHILSDEDIKNYNNILNSFKNGKEINHEQYEILLRFFKSKNLTDKEIIILLEKIKQHNIRTHIEKIDNTKLFETLNIINSGFEIFDDISWISSKRKVQLDSLIESIKTQKDIDDITIQMLPFYKGNLLFDDDYTKSEVIYLYTNLLKYYQNELYEINSTLSILDNYQEKDFRQGIIKDYKKLLESYKFLRNTMDTELSKYDNDFKEVKEEENKVKLHYGLKESKTTHFESDLKNMPKDTYKSIIELIIKFKKGKLAPSQQKQLNEAFPGNFEIKDDQIRIIYRHIKDNEYVIVGVFLKKDDNPINEYKRICSRNISLTIEEEKIEVALFNKMNDEARNGGRRNAK